MFVLPPLCLFFRLFLIWRSDADREFSLESTQNIGKKKTDHTYGKHDHGDRSFKENSQAAVGHEKGLPERFFRHGTQYKRQDNRGDREIEPLHPEPDKTGNNNDPDLDET